MDPQIWAGESIALALSGQPALWVMSLTPNVSLVSAMHASPTHYFAESESWNSRLRS